ncbi:5235_t:CDS:1 [Funneliformis geosporum]|uniref:16255_t:CDS:1 n=1 Tax=Funneliformis geosporum TaxID=1117311 RepID=A0A9W4T1P6_9GLOM|nr:16255_t:CDS:1 [Funneliformis geosporum]CAI2189931.1 5235_t:CDS:1 [Funneliformis geosporum]
MGKVTKKSTTNTQPNDQNKKKRKGRPPKSNYVQQIDTAENSLSSTRPRVVSIRRNEIPMRPEIHISPTPIPSLNEPSSNIHQSGQIPLPKLPNDQAHSTSATTGSKITITMTSVTTNNTVRSNTTTYVTTEILPAI